MFLMIYYISKKNAFNNKKLLKVRFITKKIIINQKLLLQTKILAFILLKN